MSDPTTPTAPEVNPLLIFERSLYYGNYVSAILTGMVVLMFLLTLVNLKQAPLSRRLALFYGSYSGLLVALIMIAESVNVVWAEMAWVEHRSDPGGVTEFLIEQQTVWYEIMGTTASILMAMLGDAFLLYRCYVIWSSTWYVIVFPAIIFLASIALGIITLVQSAQPSGLFAGSSVDWGTPYFSITVSLNLLLALLIIARLMWVRRSLTAVGLDDGGLYTGLAAMIIESAAPMSATGIAFVVSFATESQTSIGIGQIWGTSLAVAQQLIIFRIVSGKAWTSQTGQEVSTVLFKHGTKRGDDVEFGISPQRNREHEKTTTVVFGHIATSTDGTTDYSSGSASAINSPDGYKEEFKEPIE